MANINTTSSADITELNARIKVLVEETEWRRTRHEDAKTAYYYHVGGNIPHHMSVDCYYCTDLPKNISRWREEWLATNKKLIDCINQRDLINFPSYCQK